MPPPPPPPTHPNKNVLIAEAVPAAADLGTLCVVFETLSTPSSGARCRTVDSSANAAVVEGIKFQMKMWFSKCEVWVCRRAANTVAHELAKIRSPCEADSSLCWEYDVPAKVAVHVMGDLPNC